MTEVPHLVCTFDSYSPEDERRRESLLLLGNGVLSVRGAATSAAGGESHYPGTYHGGTYNRLADTIEGEPVENESLVNLPNWLPLEFRTDRTDGWCAVGCAEILDYRHSLDAAEATTLREATLRSGGARFRLRERRLVSMCQPNVAALQVELTPLDWSGRIEIRSLIDGAVENAGVARHRHYDGRHLLIRRLEEVGPGILLVGAETNQSHVRIGVAARTRVSGVTVEETAVRRSDAAIAQHAFCRAEAGRSILIEKAAVILTSRDPAISEPDEAACGLIAELPDFDGLLDAHRSAWRRIWKGCRIRTEREDLGNALEFHASYLFQNTSPHTASYDTGIPSRGWQEGYHGHIFWDSVFSSEVLATRLPDVARSLLVYRYRRLDAARKAAKLCGLRGAMYPWRSAADGREVTPRFQYNPLSGRWMRDHTHRQRHVGSVIAYQAWRYFHATGDREFLSSYGATMILEIARFWASLARTGGSGRYEIHGVIGPDEYHTLDPATGEPGLRNNTFTNVMAAWTLARAAEVLRLLPDRRAGEIRESLGIGREDFALWDDITRNMRLVIRDDGVIGQFEGFDQLIEVDLDSFRKELEGRRTDWALEARGDDVNRYQVVKQADTMMLLYLLSERELADIAGRCGYRLTPEQLCRTGDYYLKRTTHESSLSDLVYAGALSRLAPASAGNLYWGALRPDGETGHSGTDEGVHLGAMAATIDVVQRHFAGMTPRLDGIEFDPAPPDDLGWIAFEFAYQSGAYEIRLDSERLELSSDPGNPSPIRVSCQGRVESLTPGSTLRLPVSCPPPGRSAGDDG